MQISRILHLNKCIDFQLCTPPCGPYDPNAARPNSSLTPKPDPFCKPIPATLKSLHDDLNTRVLRRSIDRSFEADKEPINSKPEKSFKLLSKMAEITNKVCGEEAVGMRILETAVDLFQVAHEGRGFYFHEDLSPKDSKFILNALDNCLNDVEPLETQQSDCEGEVCSIFCTSFFCVREIYT